MKYATCHPDRRAHALGLCQPCYDHTHRAGRRRDNFTCYLCDRAGRDTLTCRASSQSLICRDCADSLRSSGRRWCNRGRHVVSQAEPWRGSLSCCQACALQRNRRVPPGWMTLAALAARLYVNHSTIVRWLSLGWPVSERRIGRLRCVPILTAYPPPPTRTKATTKPCVRCGEAFTPRGRNRTGKYCDTCRPIARREAGLRTAREKQCRVCKTAVGTVPVPQDMGGGVLCVLCLNEGLRRAA